MTNAALSGGVLFYIMQGTGIARPQYAPRPPAYSGEMPPHLIHPVGAIHESPGYLRFRK